MDGARENSRSLIFILSIDKLNLYEKREAAPFNGESGLILYGTATGNSEALAKKLAEALRPTGLTARVRDMARQTNPITIEDTTWNRDPLLLGFRATLTCGRKLSVNGEFMDRLLQAL